MLFFFIMVTQFSLAATFLMQLVWDSKTQKGILKSDFLKLRTRGSLNYLVEKTCRAIMKQLLFITDYPDLPLEGKKR